jgi:hypothetical protein
MMASDFGKNLQKFCFNSFILKQIRRVVNENAFAGPSGEAFPKLAETQHLFIKHAVSSGDLPFGEEFSDFWRGCGEKENIMHEVSLNRLITDYITGEEIGDTTYEDLRQALARMLVKDKLYPRSQVHPKYSLDFQACGEAQSAMIDLAVFTADRRPALALFFCPGEVGTFVRESVAAARIHEPEPFPLVVVTDATEALLVETRTAANIGSGFYRIPRWDQLEEMLEKHPCPSLPADRLEGERRILTAYGGIRACCGVACPP